MLFIIFQLGRAGELGDGFIYWMVPEVRRDSTTYYMILPGDVNLPVARRHHVGTNEVDRAQKLKVHHMMKELDLCTKNISSTGIVN